MEHNPLVALTVGQAIAMTREEFTMMLDFHLDVKLAPVLCDRAHAVWADADQLLRPALFQAGDVRFRKLAEYQIVSQPSRRITRAPLLPQHAKAGSQPPHHFRESAHNLAALRIVGSHAAEPQTILL